MATVKLLRNTFIDGAPAYFGDIVEIDDESARYMIGAGLAEAATAEAAKSAPTKATRSGKETAAKPAAKSGKASDKDS